MITEFLLPNLPDADQRLEALFQAFDDFMLVLDQKGRILDYKLGNGSTINIPRKDQPVWNLQDVVSPEVKKKYDNALTELNNGNKVAFFEYTVPILNGEAWYETRLVSYNHHQIIMFVRNVTRHKKLSTLELGREYDKTIEGWSHALTLRDHETEDHARRVTDLTVNLASRLGVPDSELIHVRRGAILHDLGKIAIPDNILFKPGPLAEEEWAVMRRHPLIAVDILKSISHLSLALLIPRSHHEKWNGGGYPDGLSGENIPLPARIFALADVYDALTSNRPYRQAWTRASALNYINQNSGIHFDPRIAPEFIEMVRQ